MNTSTVLLRLVGAGTESGVAFVSIDGDAEVRVSHDPRRRLGWGCDECGRQREPGCVHADLVDAGNHYRTAVESTRRPELNTKEWGTNE